MTATEELRLPNDTKELDALLNERGQEHRVWPSGMVVWHDERTTYEYEPAKNHHSEYWGGILRMTMRHLTPEQAIDATLGETPTPPPPTMPEQPPYDLLIDLLRDEWGIDVSWDGLRRFWYVGLNEKGMRMRDERDATLGRGTCEVEYVSDWMRWHCKACDSLWQGLRDQRPHYCPNCGRRVEQ